MKDTSLGRQHSEPGSGHAERTEHVRSDIPGHTHFMKRCLDLARRGATYTSPNPMVGAVLVYDGRIIGEGYHTAYGADHAEVEAVRSVHQSDLEYVAHSTMYVSLEPCAHHGKTPPCTELILKSGIPRVVVAMTDPNPVVSGGGIKFLTDNGVEVITGVLEDEAQHLLRMFTKFITTGLPYVVVKFAQSRDRYIGNTEDQVKLTNAFSDVLVHKMRSTIDAIMIGTNTAVIDNPKLTNRVFTGRQPLRVVLDRTGRIPQSHQVLDGSTATLVFTEAGARREAGTEWVQVTFDDNILSTVLNELGRRRVMSVLVEGGAELITALDKSQLWDECHVFTTSQQLEGGVRAPNLTGSLMFSTALSGDQLHIFSRQPASG